MAIRIISTQAPIQEYDLGNIPVDRSRKTGVLIRQSRKGSDKNHYESRLRQESLVPVAMAIRGAGASHGKLGVNTPCKFPRYFMVF
jgi:hypothetical protein